LNRTTNRSRFYLALFTLLAFLIGCPQRMRIADIVQNPSRYSDKEVSIAGTVTESFGVLGEGAFQVEDETGKIWVLSQNYGVPSKGAKVGIVGRVHGGINIGSRSLGTAIQQTQQPHY
jgi:hypothetical protein